MKTLSPVFRQEKQRRKMEEKAKIHLGRLLHFPEESVQETRDTNLSFGALMLTCANMTHIPKNYLLMSSDIACVLAKAQMQRNEG